MTVAYCYIGQYLGELSEMWSRGRGNGSAGTARGQKTSTATLMLVVIVATTVAITVFIARCLLTPPHATAQSSRATLSQLRTDTTRVMEAVRLHNRTQRRRAQAANEQEDELDHQV